MSIANDYIIPFVIEKTGRGERQYDIYSRLLEDRIVFIGSPIDDGVANSVIAQLLFLQKENKSQDINLFLNTPGGSVTAGLAIYDTIQFVQCPVATYCIGQAASMGAVLLAAGTKGKRHALPHSRIMIHQPLRQDGGAGQQGQRPGLLHGSGRGQGVRADRRDRPDQQVSLRHGRLRSARLETTEHLAAARLAPGAPRG